MNEYDEIELNHKTSFLSGLTLFELKVPVAYKESVKDTISDYQRQGCMVTAAYDLNGAKALDICMLNNFVNQA